MFEHPNFEGDAIAELLRLRERDTVRLPALTTFVAGTARAAA